MRKHIIAVGGICATTVYRVPEIAPAPAKVIATEICELVDGMALSAACAFAQLGGTASIWARIGDDALGRSMRDTLRAEHIDTTALRTVPQSASSRAAVIVDARGERLVVPFHDPRTDASADWLPLASLRDADFVHCDARWLQGSLAALQEARRLGMASMVDGDVAPREVLAQLLPLARYAVFSDAGLFAYTGLSELEPALRAVARSHDGHVGASCGAAGYWWLEGGSLRHAPAPTVNVVDTLAAGDVFHGALALALVEGRPIEQAAHIACAAASLKCTHFGGRLGCPTRAELDAFLDRPPTVPTAGR